MTVEEITNYAIAGAMYVNGQYQREAAIVSWLHGAELWYCYGYWDKDGYLALAVKRSIDATWTIYTTAIQIGAGWSSHETISLGIDPNGYLHMAYDMHNEALKYRKSTLPLDEFVGVLTAPLSMLGTNENAVTYPVFVMSPAGKLFVLFRNGAGGSGDADTFFYAYDEGAATWSAAPGTSTAGLLLGGHSESPTYSAYFFIPVFDDTFGSGGYMHLAWTWCNAGPGYVEHDIGYARWDGTTWTKIGGGAQTVPILSTNDDHALTLSGNDLSLMSRMAVTSNGYPHIVYNQNDGTADWHRHYLYWNGAAWTDIVITSEHITYTGGAANIDLAIDPITNIAYYLYVDALAPDGVNALWSDDYITWNYTSLYSVDLGLFSPCFNKYVWRTQRKLSIPMAEWFPAGTQWHVYLLEYTPAPPVGSVGPHLKSGANFLKSGTSFLTN